MGLNEPQRRRLEVTLSLIEKQILELEICYLSGAVAEGEIMCIHHDLTDSEVDQLVHLLEQMRRHIGSLRQQFQLQPRQQDLRRVLVSQVAHFWTILHDCRTEKLKGAGRVDVQLERTLDPEIDRLIKLAEALEAVIQKGSKK